MYIKSLIAITWRLNSKKKGFTHIDVLWIIRHWIKLSAQLNKLFFDNNIFISVDLKYGTKMHVWFSDWFNLNQFKYITNIVYVKQVSDLFDIQSSRMISYNYFFLWARNKCSMMRMEIYLIYWWPSTFDKCTLFLTINHIVT